MAEGERFSVNLSGIYHDVLYGSRGQVLWDRGWTSNTIVDNARLLLAQLVGGMGALGIQGLQIGAGSPAWDSVFQPPSSSDTALTDPNPFTVPRANLQFAYVQPDGTVSANPTNRLQVRAVIGPGVPPWPDANHPTLTLREFGLVGQLQGSATPVLINYVRHQAIVKDPVSTLDRTIWLTF